METMSHCTGGQKRDGAKHVTTACSACRRKRCKCNGQTPCSACIGSESECVYVFDDRRRQPHQRTQTFHWYKQQRPIQDFSTNMSAGTQLGNSDINTCNNVDDTSTDLDPMVRQNQQDSNINNGIAQQLRSTQQQMQPPIRILHKGTATLAPKHRSRTMESFCEDLRPKPYSLREMKGKFKTTSYSNSLDADTGVLSRSYRESLTESTAPLPTQNIAAPKNRQKNRRGRQQQPDQIVWQLAHKAYPIPGYTRTFGNLPFSSAIKVNGYPANVQARQILNFSTPQHLVLPLNEPDDLPLGRALTDFQLLGQRLIAGGTPKSQVADYGLIDVTLYFRDRAPDDPVNASTWTAEMLKSFRGTFSDELLLACAICVRNLMRWLLDTTPENYANIPKIMRPTNLQRLKPHAAWVDLMMFPAFRDALAERPRDWVEPCMEANWQLLWPHPLEQALFRPPSSDRIFLTPQFAAFVDEHQNWLMQKSILETFPEIRSSEINICYN